MPKNKLYTELSTLSTKNGVESMCLNLANQNACFGHNRENRYFTKRFYKALDFLSVNLCWFLT
mgnify:FL=1